MRSSGPGAGSDGMSPFGVSGADLAAVAPEAALLVAASAILLSRPRREIAGGVALAGIAVAAAALLPQWDAPRGAFGGDYAVGALPAALKALALLGGALGVVLARSDREVTRHHPEVLAFMLLVLSGAMLLVSARHLAVAYVAFELLSVPSYAMVGSIARSTRSTEGGIKYALFGAAASGMMLYGFTLLYGLTGNLHYAAIAAGLAPSPGATVAVVLVFAGVAYKLAAAPIHYWCPDAFEAAPTSVAAFLSVAPKAAGFGLLLALSDLLGASGGVSGVWRGLLAAAAVLSMALGNLAAMRQTNVKRLLAYSSVAHAGYLLVAASSGGLRGTFAILVYLGVYVVMNVGAFHVASLVAPGGGVEEFGGLGRRSPFLALCMAVFLFSLTGLPPFGGFVGKLFILSAALDRGLYALVVALVLFSVVSLFYYARILRTMYFDAPADAAPPPASLPDRLVLALSAAAVLAMGLCWEPVGRLARLAAG